MTMDYKLIGVPCGHHGPYTFYKAFKYSKNGKTNILALSEFFFVKLWNDSDLVSIGELQLLWEDKNTEQTLASLRLYILPENTPEGRNDFHGEDEVLAITEKVVIRLEDLLTWITDATDWSWGLSAVWNRDCNAKKYCPPLRPQLLNDCTAIDLEDIDKEKDLLDESHWETSTGVVVLSFPRYCRYRGILKRLEGVHNKWLRTALVVALGGFTVPCQNTRVLFCKDTFDYPDLEGHELLCNHLAPKLKGRPRRKRKRLDSRTPSPEGSEESESESSVKSSNSSSSSNINNNNNNNKAKISLPLNRNRNGLQVSLSPRRSSRTAGVTLQEKEFLSKLHLFMKSRQTPIGRVPTIGFKEIDLFIFYNKVKHLGGYDLVTGSKLWKYVYEELGGDQNSTSAATIARRHYEKLLLPYERQLGNQNVLAVRRKQITEVASSTTPATTTATTTIPTTASNTKDLIVPSVTITPSVTATLITVPQPYAVDKDKKAIGLSSKAGSLRGVRLKQDKTSNLNLHEVKSGGKENIPVTNSTKTTNSLSSKPQPSILTEFIDLVSDDSQSPSKANVSITVPPSLKKQKLEILKEGGLEVTPVATTVNKNNPQSSNNAKAQNSNNNSSSKDNSIISVASNNTNDDNAHVNISSSNNNGTNNSSSSLGNGSNTNSNSINILNNSSSSSSSTSNPSSNSSGNEKSQPTMKNNSISNQNRTTKSDDARPSVIRHTYPDGTNKSSNSKKNISITVTPDITSMLTMPGLSSPRLQSSNSVSITSSQQHRSSQPLPGLWPGRPVYGNPKDIFQQSVKRPIAEEVLDLRTKSDNRSNSTQPKQNNTARNVTNSYGSIGSNLEITLVPANKYNKTNSSSNSSPSVPPSSNHPTLLQQPQPRRRKSHVTSHPLFPNGCNLSSASLRNLSISNTHPVNINKQQLNSSLIVPNVSLTVNQKKQLQQLPQQIHKNNHQNQNKIMSQQISSTTVPQPHQNNLSSSSSRLSTMQNNAFHQLNSYQNHKMPFIPTAAFDPIYLSALLNGFVTPPNSSSLPSSTSTAHRHSNNSVYNNYPTAEQLQSYRELLRRHSLPHTMLPDGFPRLINDGSTSITLVSSHSTPTSK